MLGLKEVFIQVGLTRLYDKKVISNAPKHWIIIGFARNIKGGANGRGKSCFLRVQVHLTDNRPSQGSVGFFFPAGEIWSVDGF